MTVTRPLLRLTRCVRVVVALGVASFGCSGPPFGSPADSSSGGSANGGAPNAGASNGGSGGGIVTSNVDDAAIIGQLNAADRQSLCMELVSMVNTRVGDTNLQAASCTQQAWAASNNGTDPSMCTATFDDCMRLPLSQFYSIDCGAIVDFTDQCTTARAMRSCYNAFGQVAGTTIADDISNAATSCEEAATQGGPGTLPGQFEPILPSVCQDACDNACGGCQL